MGKLTSLVNGMPLTNVSPTNYFLLYSVITVHVGYLPVFHLSVSSD